MTLRVLAVLVPAVGALALALTGFADPPAPAAPAPAEAPKGVAALAWLEGQWQSADGKWEACYSSPVGGEILSATKKIEDGKVTLFDFERFREVDGVVVLTPFPHGKASVDFKEAASVAPPGGKIAIFNNPEHDFPQRMRYTLTADGHLKIMLMAEKDGRHVGFGLDLVRKPK
jgi:hypothetical protein